MTTTTIHWLTDVFPNLSSPIGVSSSGQWYYKHREDVVSELTSNTIDPCLLPLLQEDFGGSYSFVYENLSIKLAELNFSSTPVDIFPFEAIVKTALSGNSPFWIALALNWLEEFRSISFELYACLEISYEKGLSQKLSHRLLDLI